MVFAKNLKTTQSVDLVMLYEGGLKFTIILFL